MQYQAAYISGEFSDDSRQDWDDLYPRPISWSCWYPTSIDAATTELRFGGDAESPLFTQGLVAENAQIFKRAKRMASCAPVTRYRWNCHRNVVARNQTCSTWFYLHRC